MEEDPKVVDTENSLGFVKACEDLFWNHNTSIPLRSETNGVAERAVESQRRQFPCSRTVRIG